MLSFVDRRRACPHPQWLRRCEGRRHLTAYFLYSGSPSTGAFGMSPYRQLATLETPFLRQLVSPSIRPPTIGIPGACSGSSSYSPTPGQVGREGEGRRRVARLSPPHPCRIASTAGRPGHLPTRALDSKRATGRGRRQEKPTAAVPALPIALPPRCLYTP
jgi:hypothetical protein